jgi:predicted tellurium resistance membrane protein TerC
MVRQIGVMVAAVVISVGFMMVFAGAISAFVERHPTVKVLALSFLLMIGVRLIAAGFTTSWSKATAKFCWTWLAS